MPDVRWPKEWVEYRGPKGGFGYRFLAPRGYTSMRLTEMSVLVPVDEHGEPDIDGLLARLRLDPAEVERLRAEVERLRDMVEDAQDAYRAGAKEAATRYQDDLAEAEQEIEEMQRAILSLMVERDELRREVERMRERLDALASEFEKEAAFAYDGWREEKDDYLEGVYRALNRAAEKVRALAERDGEHA